MNDTPATIKHFLDAALGTERLDAEVLLSHVLDRPRSYLHAWPERPLTPGEQSRFMSLIRRRRAGEPIAYITGRQEFWSLTFDVNRATLIPRPETELLVETALQLADPIGSYGLRLADLGTGSGCIALALAHERPRWQITAVDVSDDALQMAQRNARRLGIDNVEFLWNDWLSGFSANTFDIIVSNPPYIRAGDPHLHDIRHEPQTALVAGPDGLDALRRIIAEAKTCLKPNGLLLLEIGHDQSEAVNNLIQAAGYTGIQFKRDLAGIPRVCAGWAR
ncbi:MAG TPA: peptide chain release factor N(5)-glutamine methyltransferase [Gammaproteobacteria bacterium]